MGFPYNFLKKKLNKFCAFYDNLAVNCLNGLACHTKILFRKCNISDTFDKEMKNTSTVRPERPEESFSVVMCDLSNNVCMNVEQ